MRPIKRFDEWLCLHSKQYKLWRVSKALGITPYKWQRAFALGKTDDLCGITRRGGGKTMAVMLRLLLLPPDADNYFIRAILGVDPDYKTYEPRIMAWYRNEYKKLSTICDNAGIPVVMYQKDGQRKMNFVKLDNGRLWRY